MDILEIMSKRRSARAFSPERIDRRTLEKVIDSARNAPSAINMQPWEIFAVMGDELARLTKKIMKRFLERQVSCGPGTVKPIPEKYIARSRECAEMLDPLLGEMGTNFKIYVNEGSVKLYGAPAALFIFLDSAMYPDRLLDVGIFLGYFVLAAHAHGLATCPVGLISAYEEDIADYLNVPDTKRLVISLAIGRADETAPVNRFRSPRAEIQDQVKWFD